MMHGSWNKRHNGHNFFGHFWPYSALLPPNSLENQNLEKMEKSLEMSSFYRCATKFMIIWCMLPEIWSVTDIIFCHFGSFFVLFHYWPPKLKFGKNVKETPGDIILLNMCNINEDHIMYGSCDIRHSSFFFVILGHFLPFFPTNNPKN